MFLTGGFICNCHFLVGKGVAPSLYHTTNTKPSRCDAGKTFLSTPPSHKYSLLSLSCEGIPYWSLPGKRIPHYRFLAKAILMMFFDKGIHYSGFLTKSNAYCRFLQKVFITMASAQKVILTIASSSSQKYFVLSLPSKGISYCRFLVGKGVTLSTSHNAIARNPLALRAGFIFLTIVPSQTYSLLSLPRKGIPHQRFLAEVFLTTVSPHAIASSQAYSLLWLRAKVSLTIVSSQKHSSLTFPRASIPYYRSLAKVFLTTASSRRYSLLSLPHRSIHY